MDMLKSAQSGDATQASYIPNDETLRAMFEAAKDDKIQATRHRSNQNMIIGGLLIIICAILFVTHWRWMQKITRTET
jgi:hypothetical protein